MTSEERLAAVVSALESVGISCLVLGGHAVRHYGLARHTDDFDLQISANVWQDLPELLARSGLFQAPPIEGDSWRSDSFRRFRLGALADGRDEWLEFWKDNHLLASFEELASRAETATYGGRMLNFLGLPDLIRSKETERDKDWRDVAVLEQVLDARSLARVRRGELPLATALSTLRSRAGFESFAAEGWLGQTTAVESALAHSAQPVTQAILIPFAPNATRGELVLAIEPVILERLRTTVPVSSMHLSLVEIVRRRYILFRKDADRRDKQQVRQRGE